MITVSIFKVAIRPIRFCYRWFFGDGIEWVWEKDSWFGFIILFVIFAIVRGIFFGLSEDVRKILMLVVVIFFVLMALEAIIAFVLKIRKDVRNKALEYAEDNASFLERQHEIKTRVEAVRDTAKGRSIDINDILNR